MRKLAAVLAGLLVPAFLLAGSVVNTASAQEKAAKPAAKEKAAKPAPEVKTKVLLDNAKVKAYELTYAPGAENTGVASSAVRIVRTLKAGTLTRTYADGKKEEVVWKAGEARQLDAGPAYTAKNNGKTEVQLYVVLLK
jgi:hypothetical protein